MKLPGKPVCRELDRMWRAQKNMRVLAYLETRCDKCHEVQAWRRKLKAMHTAYRKRHR